MSTYVQETRRTLVLSGPIIIGQVSQMLMGVTDSIMIGRVGKVPLAASAFTNSVFGLFFMIGIGLLIPVSIMVSQAHGGGDEEQAGEWLKHGVMHALAVSVGGIGLLLLLSTQLHHFNQPEAVMAEVNPYFLLIVFSLLPTMVFQVLRQYAESLERPLLPMVLMLLGVMLNILLNWILIYGNWGAPALGLAGAGWATLISRTAGMVVIALWLRGSPHFRSAWPRQWRTGYAWPRFKRFLALGVPIAFALMFEGGAFGAAAVLMGWIGTTPLAAHQIALSCAAFTFMFPLGLSMAVAIRVGRAVGRRQWDVLRPISYGAQALSAAFMGTCALIFLFGGTRLAAGFVSEPEVIALAAQLLVIAAVFQLADGAQVVAAAGLRGLTDVKVPTAITAVAYWGLALPAAYGLGFHTAAGPQGVWMGLAAGLVFAAVFLMVRFARLTRPDRLAARG